MGTILDSVNNLSDKLGVTAREQTIKDQLDLCVERLGGEGNSVDIAESANKFADKEDGTATFTTKTITENGTYAASDDGVSGYSSVTVESEPYFNEITVSVPANSGASNYSLNLVRLHYSSNGEYVARTDTQVFTAVCCTPASKIDVSNVLADTKVIFTPGENFDGFYVNGEKIVTSGDEITNPSANDTYIGVMGYAGNPIVIAKKTSQQFPFTFTIS